MVTEFIPRGSLEQLLHYCDDHLSLAARLRIATECAEVLSCMHAMYQPVIHGDIKPANILLDGNFGAKVSDFGISRLLSIDKAQYTVNVIRSRGYVDPEFLLKGLIDPRNDVYSFGVVLLELITRKKVWENGSTTNLTEDFNQAVQKGKKVREMFDADITNMSNMKILEKIGKLAADCLKSDLSKRPEMKYVVQRLYMLTEKYHEKGEEETGISGIRGAKTSSRESTVTLNRRGSWDIFNRNARSNYYSRNGSAILENTETVKIFKKEELKPIIKYSNIIMGGGRFYSVYKGLLGDRLVAVKQCNSFGASEINQFVNEITIQHRLVHRNIVRFIGCCLEGDVPLLVYDIMSERSLHDILHGTIRVPLDIDVRLNIALESAEALAYLHSETASGILYGDVKPSNILLDDNFSPKILRMAPRKHIDYYIISGINYIDPLYLTTGLFTTKSDTCSFGLVLLELITRKEASREWVGNFRASNYGQKGATELFDSDIVEPRNLVVLDSLTGLILECLENLDERPTMTYVARRLRETKDSLKILVEGGVPSRAIY